MIKLLIVDDSALMRRLLTEIFGRDGGFEIETARSGEAALARLDVFRPDVVTLDINMPGMSGLACLDRIMRDHPCPVVMLSALTREGAEETLEAMALGAVDFVTKPKGILSIELEAQAQVLVETVRNASRASFSRTRRLAERVRAQHSRAPAGLRRQAPLAMRLKNAGPTQLVVVGCSTGGPPALDHLLKDLPADFPAPIVIAQHMPASFTGPLARRLDKLCAVAVHELTELTRLQPGHVYVARGGGDAVVSRRLDALVGLPAPSGPHYMWHPSVERLVETALQAVPAEVLIGVMLTGMGSDGAAQMTELRAKGGRTIAEAAETAVVWGMPGALVEAGGAEFVEPIDRIGSVLAALVA